MGKNSHLVIGFSFKLSNLELTGLNYLKNGGTAAEKSLANMQKKSFAKHYASTLLLFKDQEVDCNH